MANLWDYLTQPSRASKPIDYGNYADETLYNATAVPRFISNTGKSVYDSFKRGMVNPNVEDAFNVAGAAVVGGMPGVPAGNSPSTLGMAFRSPIKTVDAYKIFNVKNNKLGDIFPMFIGKNKPTPRGEWIPAEFLPTQGYADRGGWHAGILPIAPHLMSKTGQMPANRVWAKVSMPDDVDWNSILKERGLKDLRGELPIGGTYDFKTNKMQGDAWKIGGALRVDNVLSDEEVAAILAQHNLIPALPRDSSKAKAYMTLMEMLGKK